MDCEVLRSNNSSEEGGILGSREGGGVAQATETRPASVQRCQWVSETFGVG